jgi:hypothetical protein
LAPVKRKVNTRQLAAPAGLAPAPPAADQCWKQKSPPSHEGEAGLG